MLYPLSYERKRGARYGDLNPSTLIWLATLLKPWVGIAGILQAGILGRAVGADERGDDGQYEHDVIAGVYRDIFAIAGGLQFDELIVAHSRHGHNDKANNKRSDGANHGNGIKKIGCLQGT